LHVDATGRLLEEPIGVPGVKAPQNPTLDLGDPQDKPTVATSRGIEGMAISPDGRLLHPMFEGPVGDDDNQSVQILTYDIRKGRFTDDVTRVRLEMPGQPVNLAAITRPDGTPVYPGTVAPAAGGQSIGDLKAVNDHQYLFLERDGQGDGPAA